MSDNVAAQNPDIEFIRPCNLCPHMKRMSLANIRRALETMTHEVTVDPALADRARAAVERMLRCARDERHHPRTVPTAWSWSAAESPA